MADGTAARYARPMCGRFTLRTSPAQLAEIFALLRAPELKPRYNIAPTQPVAVVRAQDGGRQLSLMHWGLIPSWSRDPSAGARMINARAETVASRPAFRSAFRRQRCLIPADGFYEWKKVGAQKQPYYFSFRSGEPFAFAGLWEHWGHDGSAIDSCTIITTEPNELAAQVHDRMPVIIGREDYDRWLDPENHSTSELQALLVPCPADEMAMRPVSRRVNSPRNEGPECTAETEGG